MNESARLYYSERNIPLVYVRQPLEDKTILTIENYMKWYNLFQILPTGAVRPANFHEHVEPLFSFDGPVWRDHVPNPDAVEIYAQFYGYEMDDNAMDMIRGRWQIFGEHRRDRTLIECAGKCGTGIIPSHKYCHDCATKEIERYEAEDYDRQRNE